MEKENTHYTPWISCFDSNTEDPFYLFKDNISFELEQHITKVANQIHEQQPTSSMKDCQNLAINLLIERLLVLQKEYTPQSQRSMIINLFSYLPELKDFRYEIIQEAQKKNNLFSKLKSFFKK